MGGGEGQQVGVKADGSTFAIEAGKIVISKLASGIKTDRREQLRVSAAKVRQSMSPAFRQMDAEDVMAFLRADDPEVPQPQPQPQPHAQP